MLLFHILFLLLIKYIIYVKDIIALFLREIKIISYKAANKL